eukprot:gene19971-26681_t
MAASSQIATGGGDCYHCLSGGLPMAASSQLVTVGVIAAIVSFGGLPMAASSQLATGYLNELFTWMDSLVDEYGASRMESTSKPGFVQISEATMALLESSQQEKFVPSGGVEVKGRGLMQTYLWDCDHLVYDQSVEPYLPTIDDSTGSYHTQAPQSTANADLCHSVTDKLFDGPGNNSNGWDEAAPPNNIAPMGSSGLNPPNNIARMGSSGPNHPNNIARMGSSGLEPPSNITQMSPSRLDHPNNISRMGSSGLDPLERLSPFPGARSTRSSPNLASFARWLQAYNLSQQLLDKGQRVKHQAGGGDRKPRISGP